MSLSTYILIFIILLVLAVVYIYNDLVVSRMRVKEALSHIDVQLKRRYDLIPNLVEVVKGYASHEKKIFENLASARASLIGAKGPREKAIANNTLDSALKTLFAVAENYPDLKASKNFSDLQEELADTENKIAYARQFYNSNVMDYNTKLGVFPYFLVANILGFKPADFFEAEDETRESVKVKFS